jgi:hypothetical protein
MSLVKKTFGPPDCSETTGLAVSAMGLWAAVPLPAACTPARPAQPAKEIITTSNNTVVTAIENRLLFIINLLNSFVLNSAKSH